MSVAGFPAAIVIVLQICAGRWPCLPAQLILAQVEVPEQADLRGVVHEFVEDVQGQVAPAH
jgi:hypothetical protein